jgi:UPF0176 protein
VTGTHGRYNPPLTMFLNLAAYAFVDLDDLPARRERLHTLGRSLGLRGTILLAPEGINLCLSGVEAPLRDFMDTLRAEPGLAGLDAKESRSETLAFDRLLVKLKREVITFGRTDARPADGRAPAVSPADLARWLDAGHDDQGRPLTLIDTRNAFEVGVGAFEGAIDLGLRAFTDLPAALDAHRGALAGRRLVTYCTGGIRCEKAALAMAHDGFEHVVQLDGGVLRWFETQGARHWRGELFVFDRRVALRPDLSEGAWHQPPGAALPQAGVPRTAAARETLA